MTNGLVKEYQNEKYLLEIIRDSDIDSPRTWDNLGTMVCFTRNYRLGDVNDINDDTEQYVRNLADSVGIKTTYEEYDEEYEEYDEYDREIEDILEDLDSKLVMLHLYFYDSYTDRIKYSKRGYNGYGSRNWIGFIYITFDDIKKEYGNASEDNINKVIKYMEGEVEVYSQYLEGDVYGFQLHKKTKCECCNHIETSIDDSCWGFYGIDFEESGMIEHFGLDKEELEDLLNHPTFGEY